MMGATPGKLPRILPRWLSGRCPHCDEEWDRVLRYGERREQHEAQCRRDAETDEAQPQQPNAPEAACDHIPHGPWWDRRCLRCGAGFPYGNPRADA